MNKKYSQCCGVIAEEIGAGWVCTHCKRTCQTRGYYENEKTDELLTEIRDILLNIQNKL